MVENTLNKIQGNFLKEVHLKAKLPFVFTFVIGISLFFTKSFGWVSLGIALIIFTVLMYIKFPDRKIAEVYQDGVILFVTATEAIEVLWPEITLWHYDEKNVGDEALRIELVNGEVIFLPLFTRGYLVKSLNKHCPDQEYNKLQLTVVRDKIKSAFKKK